jgi:hypothetical protein
LRGTAARVDERPHKDVRAGRSEADAAAPWMAGRIIRSRYGHAICVEREFLRQAMLGFAALSPTYLVAARVDERSHKEVRAGRPEADAAAPWMAGPDHPKPLRPRHLRG